MTWPVHELDDAGWSQIEDAVHRLEQAWHAESQPDIETYLVGLEPPIDLLALVECIKVDLEYHWRTMQPAFLESYLERWPKLKDDPACILELLVAECATRATFSMPVTSDELQRRRFGDLADEIDLEEIETQASKDRVFATEDKSVNEDGKDTLNISSRTNAPPVYLPLTIGQSFGRYKIRGQLGSGGEGNVYRAYDRQMDREVALKFPRHSDAEVLERFLRQSKVAAKLEHRNICRVYDAGDVGGVHFIVMELIRGTTIQERLAQNGPFDCREAVTLVRTVATALGRVHEADIVHRDIKSANIMIDPDGTPILMDFGLARSVEKSVGMTTTGAFAGTLAFMSPEVANGEPADQQSDIYSLGVVLYQMLTGQVPFSEQPAELLRQLGRSPAPSPRALRPEVPQGLDDICRRAMAPRRDDRYPSADELADALRRYQHDQPQEYKPPRKPRPRWLWPTIASGVAAILLGVYFFLPPGDRGRQETRPPEKSAPPSVDRWFDTPTVVSAFAATADGRQVFVADSRTDDVCVIRQFDLAEGKPLAAPITIPEFQGGYDLVLSKDDRHLYVAAMYGNSIVDVDLAADRSVTRIPIISADKMSDPDWWRWASRLLLTPDGNKIVVPMGNDNRPDLEPDPKDPDSQQSWRARFPNDQLSIVDISGDQPRLIQEVPLGDEPTGGKLGISGDSRFAYFTTRPRPVSDTPKLYEVQLEPPYAIRTLAFPDATLDDVQISDKLGRIYVSDCGHRVIWIVDRDTLTISAPVGSFDLNRRTPTHLSIDDENSLLTVALSGDKWSLGFLDAYDGRMLARLEPMQRSLDAAIFAPDRKSVLAQSHDPGGIGIISVPTFRRKIVFCSHRGGGTWQLYTMDPDGENVTPVLADPSFSNETRPRWSPDGEQLAFISDRDVRLRVCLVRPGDSDVHVFDTSTPAGIPALDWAPDGKQLVYADSGGKQFHLLDVATGKVRPLNVTFPGIYREINAARWARDGCLYATVMPIRDCTRSELFRISLDRATVEQLTHGGSPGVGCRELSVARDGRIAILRCESADKLVDSPYLWHPERPVTEAFERIAGELSSIRAFDALAWFPEGDKMAFSGSGVNTLNGNIWVYDLATHESAMLAAGQWNDSTPDVSVRLPDPPSASVSADSTRQ